MTKDVAVAVLRSRIAKIAAETDIRDGALQIGPLVDGDVFKQYEASSIDELGAEFFEKGAERGQGEKVLQKVRWPFWYQAPTVVIPVKGNSRVIKLSAATLNSSISSGLNGCVHRSGRFW